MTYRIIWIFVFFGNFLQAQDTLLVKIITSQYPIRELVSDVYGRVYVKTTQGVFEFDGEHFIETDIQLPVNETMVYYEGSLTTLESLRSRGILYSYNHDPDGWSLKVNSPVGVTKVLSNKGIYWVLFQHKYLYGYKILNNFKISFKETSSRGLYFDGQHLWVGTYDGIYRDGKRVLPDNLNFSNTNFTVFKDHLYFGGNQSLYRYNFERDKIELVLIEKELKRLIEISSLVEFNNQLWIGGIDGIANYDGNGLKIIKNGFKVNNLSKLFQRLWISTDQGAFYIDESKPEELNQIKGLVNVTGAFEFGEKILFTSFHGLWEYDFKSNSFKNLLDKTNFSDVETTGVIGDNAGNLWIATSQGILCLRILTGEVFQYLENYEFNRRSYLKLGNLIYFGAVQGLVHFNFEDIIKSQTVQNLSISNEFEPKSTPFWVWIIFFSTLFMFLSVIIYFRSVRKRAFNDRIIQLQNEELHDGNLTFDKMEAYILEHIDSVNVDQLRLATGMSKYAFYMGFERYFGKTPKDVIFEMKKVVAQQKRKESLISRKK
jgi:hypothetical protein